MPRKTHKFPRSQLAETIARQWMKAAKTPRMACPPIRISWSKTYPNSVTGSAWGNRRVHLTLGVNTDMEDWLVLLAHELAHCVVNNEKRKLGFQGNGAHGPRFQWWLWRLLPKKYWAQASNENWTKYASAHDPSFQPLN